MSISRHQAVGAYRRWQPTDFDAPEGAPQQADEAPPRPRADPAAAASAPVTSPADPPVLPTTAPEALADHGLPADFHLPTAEEIERMHEELRRAGFEEGRSQGHAEGLAAGREEGYAEGRAQAEVEAQRLATLADGLDAALQALDNEIAEEIMALAIEMARRMVRLTLDEHPESVLETVRGALMQLPQGHAQIHLHPEDFALVREHMGETIAQGSHRLHADAGLQRGECRIDGQGAQVDATLETRWRRVLESIGHDHARWTPTPAAQDAAEVRPDGAARPADAPEDAAP